MPGAGHEVRQISTPLNRAVDVDRYAMRSDFI